MIQIKFDEEFERKIKRWRVREKNKKSRIREISLKTEKNLIFEYIFINFKPPYD